jgi:hypothetical protein
LNRRRWTAIAFVASASVGQGAVIHTKAPAVSAPIIGSRLYLVGVIECQDVIDAVHPTSFPWHTYPLGDEIKVSISPSPLNFFD